MVRGKISSWPPLHTVVAHGPFFFFVDSQFRGHRVSEIEFTKRKRKRFSVCFETSRHKRTIEIYDAVSARTLSQPVSIFSVPQGIVNNPFLILFCFLFTGSALALRLTFVTSPVGLMEAGRSDRNA